MSLITKSEELEAEVRFEAIHQGHAFMKLKLNPGAFRRAPREYRMCGVKAIKGSRGASDETGRPNIGIRITGGDISFIWNKEDREWIGWLLDDKDKGAFSKVGYNRDVIASHVAGVGWAKAVFHLDEKDEYTRSIKKDVEDRILRMENSQKSAEQTAEEKRLSSLSEIDRSMEELMARKQAMLSSAPSTAKEEAPVANHKAAG